MQDPMSKTKQKRKWKKKNLLNTHLDEKKENLATILIVI